MNSSIYHQIAKTSVNDRLQAAERARTLRAARPAKQRRPVFHRALTVIVFPDGSVSTRFSYPVITVGYFDTVAL